MHSPSSSSFSSSALKRKNIADHVTEPDCKRIKVDGTVHDVFVSFSFEETGNGFTAHLKEALKRHGFNLFDHTMIPPIHDVSSQLLKAIQNTQIYLLVFSPKYVFSERCLDELLNIMKCLNKSQQRKVLPVFFNVQPSDVRNQQGSCKEAFVAHQTNFDSETVRKWKEALTYAATLSGCCLQKNENEHKFVKKIVKEVEKLRNPEALHVADHPVGIPSRVEELISYLRLDSEDVKIVAVLGISGIGKSTIAKATYNAIAKRFDAHCFLEDIHDFCAKSNWKLDLPKHLISCLTQGDNNSIIYQHTDGATIIKRLICGQPVLLVLDDVDDFEQLQRLGVHLHNFYPGSRVIVTTRDAWSLGRLPYTPYHPRLLDEQESHELSTRLASELDDQELVKEIAWCARGLPLVIETLSAHFRHVERECWPNEIKKLKRIPHDDVQRKLKMSYDSLNHRQQKLFLDIACFFHGATTYVIVKVLEDEKLAFYPNVEIRILVNKCLVINMESSYHRVQMHGAIEDMGKEIVRRENEDEPGKRSRLWDRMDVVDVLTKCWGTEAVESIELAIHNEDEDKDKELQVEALRKMINLRLIMFYGYGQCWTCSNDNMPPLSLKKLKYFHWECFPLKCISIDMPSAVVVRLQGSKLEMLWDGNKSLENLSILDVSYSSSLTKTGNFSKAQNLEELRFDGCGNLRELHCSVGCLDKLVSLNLYGCKELQRFPTEAIVKLRSLQRLDLTDCSKIGTEHTQGFDPFRFSLKEWHCLTELRLSNCNILKISDEIGSLTMLRQLYLKKNRFPSLPDGLEKLHQLEAIYLSGCASLHSIAKFPPNIKMIDASHCVSLKNLPSNTCELKSLTELRLEGCSKLGSERLLKFTGLTNLVRLNMKNYNVSQVPNEIGNLVSLQDLDLSGNIFVSLPDDLEKLHQLKVIDLSGCASLHSIAKFPPNIETINASHCVSLKNLPSNMCELKSITELRLESCSKHGSECLLKFTGLTNLERLNMKNCNVSLVPNEIGNLVSLQDLIFQEIYLLASRTASATFQGCVGL